MILLKYHLVHTQNVYHSITILGTLWMKLQKKISISIASKYFFYIV
jgi:hypothetical protein